MGFFGNTVNRFFGMLGYFRADDQIRANVYGTRIASFAVNEMMYGNTVYEPRIAGGALESILEFYFGWNMEDIRRLHPNIFPHFNPAKEIVDSYLNVLPGTWGHEMQAAPLDPTKPLDTKLKDAIGKVWRDSNLDTAKQSMQVWCANLGTVGIRPVRSTDGSQIRIQIDQPSRLFNIEEDSQGNIVSAVLKYITPHNNGTDVEPDYENVEVVEIINKDEFSMTFDGAEQIADDARANTFGFCPYVILRHRDNGTLFGDWAYKGAERVVHAINYRISRQDKSIDRHQFPNWFAAAGGQRPETIALEEEKLTYVQQQAGMPAPMLEAIVPQINQSDAQKFWMELRDMLRGRQPELTINDVRLLAGISGETLAQVLKPAESAILAVRPAYDHALIRAIQMALSIGVETGVLDISAGSGLGAGERAYQSGAEAFQFAPRPALPQTVYDQAQQAKADTAKRSANLGDAKAADGIVDDQEQLRIAGYDDGQAQQILIRKRQQAKNKPAPQPGDDPMAQKPVREMVRARIGQKTSATPLNGK